MKRAVFINSHSNSGSTGRINEGIMSVFANENFEVKSYFGRGKDLSNFSTEHLGNLTDLCFHGLKSVVFDAHGLGSRRVTSRFVDELKRFNPNLIVLHNIHGYYLNYEVLFNYLKEFNGRVFWVLHDCWSFTGHCAYFDYVKCEKWKTQCDKCPQLRTYPKSFLFDNSSENYIRKKKAFVGVKDMTLICVSNWLDSLVSKSFLSEYPRRVIHNGLDLEKFKPNFEFNKFINAAKENSKKIILGVANVWSPRKGLKEFVKLSKILNSDWQIILVGIDKKEVGALPLNITPIKRTESIEELCQLYTQSDVFVNLSLEDNFPTTILESLACNTKVITYDTGGCSEALTDEVGIVIEKGNVNLVKEAIDLSEVNRGSFQRMRQYVSEHFDAKMKFNEYIELYDKFN